MIYVLVSVASVHTGNKFFTYCCSQNTEIGQVVKVSYGRQKIFGVVLEVVNKPTFKTKEVLEITDYKLSGYHINLLKWMYDFYPDDYGAITSLFIPPNINIKSRNIDANTVKGLNKSLPIATTDQGKVLAKIYKSKNNSFLLHGDTGSGKTRVFTELIKQTLANNKSVLVLTPEIGLTPQLINDIAKYVDTNITVTHSNLTAAERKRVWVNAYLNNSPTIYLGPRSAMFLPINSLGLIVIDEAHDSSYYQQQAPRYSTLYVASKLANLTKSRLILATATPNVSDYYLAQNKNFDILRMTELAVDNKPAIGEVIDITNKDNFSHSPLLSDKLIEAINESLKNGEQSMLFLNRRGSARLVQCSDCGWQAICDNCGLPLTYHHDLHYLICHVCNKKLTAPTKCPECQNTNIMYKSPGTKYLAEHLERLFAGKVIARFDADSAGKDQYYKNIDKLKNGEIDIIVGTQLITKGVDLPKLSVVGVINADSGLNLPDYGAEETTFQQLYQVTGRVGRGHRLSKFFIQTRLPNHPVIETALLRKWRDFYDTELTKRRQFRYPPFCYLAIAKISKKTESSARNNATKISGLLKKINGINTLGPSPSYYEYINGKYTWQIVLKSNKRSNLVKALRSLPSEWTIWVDPQSLL